VKIGHLSQVHSLVTDRCQSRALKALCAAQDIDLVEACA